ncbi:MAG TPA: ZIP family metal transporter [Planctomycetota bacterium]|nr:ZIP family metal transporter [Planctomycetota bacterium]
MNPMFWSIAGLLAVVCLTGAALPMARRWSQQGLHLFVAVAVGIFLGTLFLHLMPELAGEHHHPIVEVAVPVKTATGAIPEGEPEANLSPWVAALAGLLTLFLIEKIWLQGKSHIHAHELPASSGLVPAVTANVAATGSAHEHNHEHGHNHGPEHHDHSHQPAQDHTIAKSAESPSNSGLHKPGEVCDHDPHTFEVGHGAERHALVWYASFLGLTIHAMLDGVNTAAVVVGTVIPWPFLLSMLVHKASEGFSLATVIRLAGVRSRSAYTFLFLFSLMSPIGMLIGGAVASAWGEGHLGILRGFACGSFLYVAIYDLLPEVFHDSQQRLLRSSAVALGIAIVAISVIWVHG